MKDGGNGGNGGDQAIGAHDEIAPGGEEGSTSGVSTINSNKSPKLLLGLQESEVRLADELAATLTALRRDNLRLLQELVDSQRSYQDLLRTTLSEQQHYRQLFQQPHQLISGDDVSGDPSLISWLQSNQLEDAEMTQFTREGYLLDDVLAFFTRDDLRRLNLRGGTELRLWRAILEHRSSLTITTTTPTPSTPES